MTDIVQRLVAHQPHKIVRVVVMLAPATPAGNLDYLAEPVGSGEGEYVAAHENELGIYAASRQARTARERLQSHVRL